VLAVSTGCGNVSVSGAINTGSTITGSISFVQLGNVLNGTGGTIQVTFVTFLQNGASSTIGFCNDQTSLFPINQSWTPLCDDHRRCDYCLNSAGNGSVELNRGEGFTRRY
jgi:hypothetical protein